MEGPAQEEGETKEDGFITRCCTLRLRAARRMLRLACGGSIPGNRVRCPDMEKILTYTLREEDMEITAGGLVNLVLKDCVKVTGHEISAAKFTPDGITCDGVLIHVSERMRPGQTLRIVLPEEKDETKLIAVPGPVRILYEDEDLIAVDKLAGEVVHPGPGHYTDTIANYVTWYLQGGGTDPAPCCPEKTSESGSRTCPGKAPAGADSEKAQGCPGGAGLRVIGRLDKETSGVLLFAKNRAAAARLQRQRREGIFARTYLAVCEGVFPEGCKSGTIDLEMEKEPGVLMRMRVASEGGLRAVTHYEVLREWGAGDFTGLLPPWRAEALMENGKITPPGQEPLRKTPSGPSRSGDVPEAEEKAKGTRLLTPPCSLLRVEIETGRTHQIRVHMAAIGHPLVGDTLYGSGIALDPGHVKSMPDPEGHALLHAREVRLRQPFTGEPLHIISEIPFMNS